MEAGIASSKQGFIPVSGPPFIPIYNPGPRNDIFGQMFETGPYKLSVGQANIAVDRTVGTGY
jgi:hypothetical protein